MTEEQLEQETLGWLAEAGYSHLKLWSGVKDSLAFVVAVVTGLETA